MVQVRHIIMCHIRDGKLSHMMNYWVKKNSPLFYSILTLNVTSGSVPEAGLTGLGGGFREESGMGRVAVPSGYAGFTRTSLRSGTGGPGELAVEDDWMYGPTAATLEPIPC